MTNTESNSSDSDAYRGLLEDLTAIIAPLQALHLQAAEAQAPTVREILRSGSRDSRLIEHTLDHLLDHACIPQGLALFKSLCRHYWELNPQATASYINAYRDMWDSDSLSDETELCDTVPTPSNSTGLNLSKSRGLQAFPHSNSIEFDGIKPTTAVPTQP